VPYPGFGKLAGFISSSALIIVLMGVLYVMFRRRDWL
jgi:magnesium transporter